MFARFNPVQILGLVDFIAVVSLVAFGYMVLS